MDLQNVRKRIFMEHVDGKMDRRPEGVCVTPSRSSSTPSTSLPTGHLVLPASVYKCVLFVQFFRLSLLCELCGHFVIPIRPQRSSQFN
jgi:hypothetical protein